MNSSQQQMHPSQQQYNQQQQYISPQQQQQYLQQQQQQQQQNINAYTQPIHHGSNYAYNSNPSSNAVSRTSTNPGVSPNADMPSQSTVNQQNNGNRTNDHQAELVQQLQEQLKSTTDKLTQTMEDLSHSTAKCTEMEASLKGVQMQQESEQGESNEIISSLSSEKSSLEEQVAEAKEVSTQQETLLSLLRQELEQTKAAQAQTQGSTDGRTEQLFSELEAATAALSATQDKLDEVTAENTQIRSAASDHEEQLQHAQAELRELTETLGAENTGLKSQMSAVQQSAESMAEELEHARRQIGELEREIEAMKQNDSEEKETLKQQLSADENARVKQMTAEFEATAQVYAETERQLTQAKTELEQRLAGMEEKHATEVAELQAQLDTERSTTEKARSDWSREKDTLTHTREDLEFRITELTKQVETLTSEVKAEKTTTSRLGNVERMMSQELTSTGDSEDAHAKCKSVMKHLTMEISNNDQQHESTIAGLEKQVTELQLEVAEKNNLVATINANAQTLAKVNGQKRTLTQQLEELQDKFVTMTTTQMDLTTENESLKYTNQQLTNEVQEYKREMNGEEVLYIDPNYVDKLKRSNNLLANQIMTLQKEKQALKQQVSQHLTPTPSAPSVESEPSPVVNQEQSVQAAATATPEPATTDTNAPGMEESDSNAPETPAIESEGAVKAESNEAHESTEAVAKDTPADIPTPESEDTAATSTDTPTEGQVIAESSIDTGNKQSDATDNQLRELTARIEALEAEKAELEKKLDHETQLVNQLNEETATIPTYISLFHQQRKALQDSYSEKDAELTRLSQLLTANGVKFESISATKEAAAAAANSIPSQGTQQDGAKQPTPAIPVV